MSDEPRTVVSVTSTSRELDKDDPTGRARLRREYHLTLNWPASPLGDVDEATSIALKAADATGMLHDAVWKIDVTVEYEPHD